MTEIEISETEVSARNWSRGEAAWAVVLFAVAAVCVAMALATQGSDAVANEPGNVLFFLLYGVFTISIGYQQPGFGYYSFDRISQVASILVLGPVDAAWRTLLRACVDVGHMHILVGFSV